MKARNIFEFSNYQMEKAYWHRGGNIIGLLQPRKNL